MKISTLAFAAFLASAHGFAPTSRKAAPSLVSRLRMSSADDEVAALRAAAAKAREDAARLSKELGKDDNDDSVATTTPAKKTVPKETRSVQDLSSMTASIDFEGGDAASQSSELDKMVQSGDLALWKSTNLRTFPVSLNMLEQRTAGKITGESLGIAGDDVSLDDFKYATLGVTLGSGALAIASLAFLPQNIGATLCYFFALVPILFLGLGSSAPGVIAGAIASLKGKSDSPEDKLDRICRHEAGHFMAGYCCGLPVKGYSIMEEGIPSVEFHPTLEGEAAGRELNQDEIAALSVVAMSGSVAEALQYEMAKGGEVDLLELEGLLRRSQDFVGAQKQQDLTRWGALTSYLLLQTNSNKYEDLVQAFKDQKSVAECVAILESR